MFKDIWQLVSDYKAQHDWFSDDTSRVLSSPPVEEKRSEEASEAVLRRIRPRLQDLRLDLNSTETNLTQHTDLSTSDLSSSWSKNICQKETLVNLKPVSLSKPGHVWTEEWILTGLSPVNKSRGRISNRSSFSLKTNPDFGVILCTCTTAVQGGSCRRKKQKIWALESDFELNFNFDQC